MIKQKIGWDFVDCLGGFVEAALFCGGAQYAGMISLKKYYAAQKKSLEKYFKLSRNSLEKYFVYSKLMNRMKGRFIGLSFAACRKSFFDTLLYAFYPVSPSAGQDRHSALS